MQANRTMSDGHLIPSDRRPETDASAERSSQTYRIGAVARLTGIPPDTLRVWERRYSVVTPVRSEAGTRLYRAEDVSRLSLIKRLVDNGDAISHVAGLSLEHLRKRATGLDAPPAAPRDARPCRVAVFGPALPTLLDAEGDSDGSGVVFAGLYTDEMRFRSEVDRLRVDLLVLELPTIHEDHLRLVSDLVNRAGAPRTMLIYNYASRDVIARLESQHLVPKRAPVDAAELKRWCLALYGVDTRAQTTGEVLGDLDISSPPPARRFDAAALSRIAAASPTVKCECPHHLVQLVSSLVAFETYSRECENRNADDAALHAFLNAATARSRAVLEAALERVIEAEGIEV
jgi:DNA-binding transcriptional MerR regulator